MAWRSCWRLLAVLSLIFASPGHLLGQGDAADRVPLLSNGDGPGYSHVPKSGRVASEYILPHQPFKVDRGTTVLQQITGAAGIIFSGRVTSIGSVPLDSKTMAACTTVTFQVEQGIRGVSSGETLTIHEWAGLWTSGEHYRVGERVFLFLYPPSKLGLTSPVARAMGRFAMDSQGRILMNGQHIGNLGTDPILGGKPVVSYVEFVRAAGLSDRRK